MKSELSVFEAETGAWIKQNRTCRIGRHDVSCAKAWIRIEYQGGVTAACQKLAGFQVD